MRLKIEFDEGQTMFLDKVSKFIVEGNEEEPKLPEFIQKKINVKEEQETGEQVVG